MVDAQGRRIAYDGLAGAEEPAPGAVHRPILCAGRLLQSGWSLSGVEGQLHLKHEERCIEIPMNTERNSLQFEARIFAVKSPSTQRDEKEARVFALSGYLSKYVKSLEMTPGWHRLPNGVLVYSDTVASHMTNPAGSIEKSYKARLTLVKNKDDTWTQLENVEDFNSLGSMAFRRVSMDNEPMRMLRFFSPTRFKDFRESGSEVPIPPYPCTEESFGHVERSEDDAEELDELERKEMYHDVEKMVVAEKAHEVELGQVLFSEKMTVKELQIACKERQLPWTGSKKKLLERLMNFKVHLETQMHLAAASKLFEEQQRRPVTLGQPKLPSLAEQELHFVTHWPYAPWCQACVACRAKEDHYKNVSEKEDIGKNIIPGEEGRLDETPSGKVQERHTMEHA